ncbi:retention module-containing protein, partial [Halomonas urumqiensis]|uniref:retention module-containing protein n=1 Tax=Halomonas urumqiensis TaxID=1684789 RepID=UPI000D43B6DD
MIIATVVSITGQAWARDAQGNLRELSAGSTLEEGETLVTADNAQVAMDFDDGLPPSVIEGGQAVVMSGDLDAEQPVDNQEFSAFDEDLDALLTAIDEGEGDLLDDLDATAAGPGAGVGGGEGGGHSFVRLGRISELTDPLAFNYDLNALDGIDFEETEAVPTENDTPAEGEVPALTVGDAGSVNEGDTITFSVSLSNPVDNVTTLTFVLGGEADDDDLGTPTVAINGVDVTVTTNADGSFSIEVPAGTTDGIVVSVPTIDDDVFEGPESVTLTATLSGESAAGNALPDGITDTGNAIIVDDGTGTPTDPEEPADNDTPSLEVFDAGTINEGDTATFDVELSNPVDNVTTLTFVLGGEADDDDLGTPTVAINGADVTVTTNADGSFSIEVPAGTTDGIVVSVPTIDDDVFEGPESVTLTATLSGESAAGNALPDGITDTGNAIILDNDSLPTISNETASVSEEGLPGGNQDDTAGPGYTDTTNAASVTGTFAITGNGDVPLSVGIDLNSLPNDLASGGDVVSWSEGGNAATAIGSVNGVEVIRVELNGGDPSVSDPANATSISYVVTLSQPIDHPDSGVEDTLDIGFDVTIDDGVNPAGSGSLTVTVEDDSPIANAVAVTQSQENVPVVIDVFANDAPGADGVDLVTGVALVAGSLTGSGDLAYNDNGTFTYTPAPGEEGEVSFQYTLTDGDGDTSTATATLTLQDDSTPTISVVRADGDDGVVWESALPDGSGGGDLTTSGTLEVDTGNDALGVRQVQDVTGTWIDITADGTTVQGQYGELSVDLDGSWTYTLAANTLDHDGDDLIGADDQVQDAFQVRATDSDGDVSPEATLTVDINDDGPVIINNEFPLSAFISVDEAELNESASVSNAAPVDFSGVFTLQGGADGLAATRYSLLIDPAVESGLTDVMTGQTVELRLAEGSTTQIEGYVTANGQEETVLTVDVDVNGAITLTQFRALAHPDPEQVGEGDSISLTAGSVRLAVEIEDGDGDTASQSVAIGWTLSFLDDGPSIEIDGTFTLPDFELDESDDLADRTQTQSFANAFGASVDYGSDGAGSIAYSLTLGATNVATGLYALDANAADGQGEAIVLVDNNGIIEGQAGAGGDVIFTI